MQTYLPVLLLLLAGLTLFLFALNYLSYGLNAITGDKLKASLSRFTRNVVSGINWSAVTRPASRYCADDGVELGTFTDTLVASIGRSRAALRTGQFHLAFNIVSVLVGLLLIVPFGRLVLWVSTGADSERQLANAHMLFNAIGVVFIAAFVPFVADRLEQ
jgi:phosphate:Na+ symporter